MKNLEDIMIDRIDAKKLDAYIYFMIVGFWEKWQYRLFIRGKCALFGCKESYNQGGGGYLPEDCTEWWCDRCGAEGINHMVQTHEFFYKDTPLQNFVEALKGK